MPWLPSVARDCVGYVAADLQALVREALVATLRARIARNGKILGAFWIQDGDQGQKLASPLALAESTPGRWTAKVPTLDLRFTLFARIFRREDKVLIVDDVLATGGTAAATIRLVESCGATVVGLVFLIELDALNGRAALGEHPVQSLLSL